MQMRKTNTLTLVIPPKVDQLVASFSDSLRFLSEYLVVGIAFLVSLFGWRYYYDANLILSYNDSMSHLDISRRVLDNLTPGIAQIGSVWLPLPHFLSLFFVWNDFLWHSGLAGSIISNLAFIGSAFFLYRLIILLTRDRVAGFLGAVIFALNPNMIYMQSVPMTESLLIFFFIASTYYIFRWQEKDDYRHLIIAGLLTLLSTLTRYDGWMLLAQIFLVVFLVAWRFGGWKRAESRLILFGTIALYGIVLWFIWNLLIFNDPLYFFNGPFAAKTQQLVFESEGRLFTKGELWNSIHVYLLAAVENNGSIISFLGGVGAILYFVKNKLSKEALAISLLLSPLFFNIAALYLGHSIINLPDLPPYTLFNVRYGLMTLPAIALFAAFLSKKQRLLQIIFFIFLIMQTFLIFKDNDVITVRDGIYGASAQGMNETGSWLGAHAEKGLILVAASSQDSLIFQSGLPMDRFIHEGTGEYWKTSLKVPSTYASWIAMHHGDLVYRELSNNENFYKNYKKVYDGQFTDIFELDRNTQKPLTINDLP